MILNAELVMRINFRIEGTFSSKIGTYVTVGIGSCITYLKICCDVYLASLKNLLCVWTLEHLLNFGLEMIICVLSWRVFY